MSTKAWIGLFFLSLISDLVCIQLRLHAFRFVTKPMVVLSLLVYFVSKAQLLKTPLKFWIIAALCFSWLGDVLLLFEDQAAVFFLLGLSSFLLAHVCYSWFFSKVHKQEKLKGNVLFFVFVAIYYTALMRLLGPGLGALKLPVWLYGAVICIMLWIALHLHKVYQGNAGLFMLMGALLFVLSDSVLAVNKFYQHFTYAGIAVMLSYGMAQWFITEGCIRWLLARQSQG